MVAILETPSIRRQVSLLSVENYERQGEAVHGRRSELIRGIVLKKLSASPLHIFLVAKLRRLIAALLGLDLHYREEKPLKMFDSMPEPDLAVVIGQEEEYIASYPTSALLVIEVAISSLELDREKAALYAEANIPEYWIVLGEQKSVEVYTNPQSGRYTQLRRHARADTITSIALPGLAVDLAALFPAD